MSNETQMEYAPLAPHEIEALRQKEARGELSIDDCAAFIRTIRASFLARGDAKAPSKKEPPKPAQQSVDFF